MDRVVNSPLALGALVCLTLVGGAPRASAQAAQGSPVVDPVFQRAQQLVASGQDSAGRAVVDSVLSMRAEGTPLYAEALFWRARLARTAAAAERDYRRIAVEYPLSPRAAESLLLLAQLEMTRGDRASARVHLARLQREHPTGAVSTRASVTLARLAFDDGDVTTGCAAVAAALAGLSPSDVELRNQLEYHRPRCAGMAARDSSGPLSGGDRDVSRAAVPAREFSVQVAAYETRASADGLAQRLTARGYVARVVGDSRPFRVRVGRYPTRERATEVVRELSRVNVRGFVVEAERP
ncbi:MAG TPA: SPOR domain-containing protein [Gemmatimonadaceae bacterium]|jgi:hypothetical protein|nr:SPOR domain-containing protein [Gemmatimonadaceae bacterium]